MKKSRRILFGFVTACACFFVAVLTDSAQDSAAGFTTANNRINTQTITRDANSMANELFSIQKNTSQNLLTATPAPTTAPTATPTPTATPVPTATPAPTATPVPTATPIPTATPTPAPVAYVPDFTIPSVTNNMNIRKGPGTDSKIIGKISAGCYALILGEENGWVKVSTGSIKEGYLSTDYLYSAEEVMALCDKEKLVTAICTASVLNVRSGPGTHYDRITKIKQNQTYPALLSKSYEGWIAIELSDGSIGYISEEYVKFDYQMGTGLTLEEIEAASLERAIENAMAKAQIYSVKETSRTPVSMTEEELYLFATVIYTEAGDQCYEGMLAVANIILNRMEDGKWGHTLEEVLYAPGQFTGAKPDYIERARKRGIPDECYKAAKEALAGRNNIGDFRYFRTTDSAMKAADYLTYDEFYILDGHVFYKKTWR